MGDCPGAMPVLHGPWPEYTKSHTFLRPELRHINNFNAVFQDGHVQTGTLDALWTMEYWVHDFP